MRVIVLLTVLFALMSFSGAARGYSDTEERDIECLATNIYHEARGESFLGMIYVAIVTMNRVDNPKWPARVCDVVYQKKVNKVGLERCQFSWVCHEQTKYIDDKDSFILAKLAAIMVYYRIEAVEGGDLLFYYACDGTHKIDPPFWAEVYEFKEKIDNHCFYSEV